MNPGHIHEVSKRILGRVAAVKMDGESVNIKYNGNPFTSYYDIHIPASGSDPITYQNITKGGTTENLEGTFGLDNSTDNNQTKFVSFAAAPAADFDGPINVVNVGKDQSGKSHYAITGKVVVTNASQIRLYAYTHAQAQLAQMYGIPGNEVSQLSSSDYQNYLNGSSNV